MSLVDQQLIIDLSWFMVLLPLVIGLGLFSVLVYLAHRSRQFTHSLEQLYRLNQTLDQDVLSFIEQAWPILSKHHSLALHAQVDWYGEHMQIHKGAPSNDLNPSSAQIIHIQQPDVELHLALYRDRVRGEQRLITEVLQKTFLQLVEHNISIKINQVFLTQQRIEKFQLFAQHDLKNLMQFISLLNDQLRRVDSPEQCDKLIRLLQSSVPIVQQRAQRTLQQLKTTLSGHDKYEYIDFPTWLEELAQSLDVHLVLSGEAGGVYSRSLLKEVFVNLFNNFRDHGCATEPIKLQCRHVNQGESEDSDLIEIIIYQRQPGLQQNELSSVRLFEPFWTTSESGLGLGLFLTRELLGQMNARIALLDAQQRRQLDELESEQLFGFVIQLPA